MSSWQETVESLMRESPWLIAMDHAAAATAWVRLLKSWGAPRPFVLSGWKGGGQIPSSEEAELHLLDLPPQANFMEAINAFERALDDLPAKVLQAIRAWDPDGKTRVLGPFFARANAIDGRTFLGGRPRSWQDLEDKTIIDDLWDKSGTNRSEFRIVPPVLAKLEQAHLEMDQGLGTVQTADSREGFHGGASYLRWVRTPEEQQEAYELFEPMSDRVRVMPFLEGIPCSIHGMVFPDTTVAFRPMEMVVLRRPESSKLLYARAASFWNPPEQRRAEMRATACRVGDYLRDTYHYRGVFTIDGVMTSEGFLPTELNPRFGAALAVMVSGLGLASHLIFLNYLLIEGADLKFHPAELEQEIVAFADRVRAGRVGFIHPGVPQISESLDYWVSRNEAGWSECPEDIAMARVLLDPTENGTLLNIHFMDRTPIGLSVAPWTCELCAWVDAIHELGIGALIPAKDMNLVS